MSPILTPDQQPDSLRKVSPGGQPHTMLHLNLISPAHQRMHRENTARVYDMTPVNAKKFMRIKTLLGAKRS